MGQANQLTNDNATYRYYLTGLYMMDDDIADKRGFTKGFFPL